MKNTGGTWDRTIWPTYFVASGVNSLTIAADLHDHLLIAVNELDGKRAMDGLDKLIARGCTMFIDSGVFNLSMEHARAHDITMDQALSMAPERVDGFAELFERYVSLMQRLGNSVWGYIEIDQGGRENKIRTRDRLEALGLRPIPVYHPLNDGWDYFDELAQNYDRICFGNVVQADPNTRKRLMATAWERRRKYPHLWIHMLGLTPSELTTAYPPNSCDSSTWLQSVRWGLHVAQVANRAAWRMGHEFKHLPGSDSDSERGTTKATALGAYEAAMVKRTMEILARDQRETLGADIGMFER